MTPISTAVGRVARSLIFVAGAVGFFAAASALATAASSVTTAWPHVPAWSSCSLFMCVGEAINNALGIPGSVVGAVAVVVVTVIVVGSGVPVVPEFFGVNMPPTGSSGDDVTTYIPGVSPTPDKGDLIYIPSIGASKVTDVYYDPSRDHPDGTPGGIIIVTELGTISVGVTGASY